MPHVSIKDFIRCPRCIVHLYTVSEYTMKIGQDLLDIEYEGPAVASPQIPSRAHQCFKRLSNVYIERPGLEREEKLIELTSRLSLGVCPMYTLRDQH